MNQIINMTQEEKKEFIKLRNEESIRLRNIIPNIQVILDLILNDNIIIVNYRMINNYSEDCIRLIKFIYAYNTNNKAIVDFINTNITTKESLFNLFSHFKATSMGLLMGELRDLKDQEWIKNRYVLLENKTLSRCN